MQNGSPDFKYLPNRRSRPPVHAFLAGIDE